MPLEAIFFCVFSVFPFASYNEIPMFGDTVVAVVGFVCRLRSWATSKGVFKRLKEYFAKRGTSLTDILKGKIKLLLVAVAVTPLPVFDSFRHKSLAFS